MTLAADTFDFVATLVRTRSAIQLDKGKEYLVESRLAPLARSAGAADVDAFVRALRADISQHESVVEALTTNETSWFRDLNPFTVLKTHILPEFAAKGRGPLRVWSAACSTGQEPYSVAMTIADNFPSLKVQIVATDIAENVLAKGRSGRFSQLEINRGLPAPMLVKHFERQGPSFEISPQLRNQVVFRKHNLLELPPAGGPFDIVFLRNVLIYFDVDTKRSVLSKVRAALTPGGYLFLGAAETTIGVDDAWERIQVGNSSVYRPREGKRL
ncbi:protein-glutamate O-methyltransferase CheR [Demequina sp. TTPB684]|uniref:CheR family methyltransferase n=1 Tax=unclassified Demequina TaxID=2620311 RepID=UPI001CF17A36|nr:MULTISPECIES: protein-glutamate O-methyltransferase CheR [unclassified Demequina]MCB2412904.1 protein-glutamate O-methyltransferase CheR [Demequina sp. TTPB684]UPU87871.1 protein-glutamate O-methyltransferase CheR [Demequina sp. TMPB413]